MDSETEEQNHKTDSSKQRQHAEPEIIDLTMSSPVTTPERSPSTGFDYGSADEHEVN